MSSLSATEQQVFHRTRLLVGDAALERIHRTRVILFGVGGVGSWCAESLVRSGVQQLTLVDSDCVSITNVNRQLPATLPNVGRVKVEALRERLLTINPDAQITARQEIYNADNAESFHLDTYDVIIDAIDSLAEKAHLLLTASRTDALLVSSMGAALKMDPSRIAVAEFWKAEGCPLARALRNKFKRAKTFPAKKFRVVYSNELLPNLGAEVCSAIDPDAQPTPAATEGRTDLADHNWNAKKAQINGAMVHITAIFGFTLAGIVLNDLYGQERRQAKP